MSEQNESSPYFYDEPKKLNLAAKYFMGGLATAAVALVGAQIVLPALAETFTATSELPGDSEASAETITGASNQINSIPPQSSDTQAQTTSPSGFGPAPVSAASVAQPPVASADPAAVPGLAAPTSSSPVSPKQTLVFPDFNAHNTVGNVSSATPAVGGGSTTGTYGGATGGSVRGSRGESHERQGESSYESESDED